MIGAIIGDLAASTYERDKDNFFRQLIDPYFDALELQRKFIAAIEFINGQGSLDGFKSLRQGSDYVAIWKHNIIGAIALGWISDSLEQCEEYAHRFHDEKEDWYAAHFLSKLIFVLRHGDTKRRALKVEHIGTFASFVQGHWQNGDGPLSYLVRAWKAFEKSFDFGSALHAAIELPGDLHINCILVGALADAMYGHQQYIRKQKYKGGVLDIDITLLDYLRDIDSNSWQNRTFFPKNNARTNVERHTWTPINIPSLENIHFSKEARRRILKSFYTGWDNRYGFYWDDGWFYSYRSFVLIGRFRLTLNDDGTYSITQIQVSNENHDLKSAIEGTIYPTLYSWLRFGEEDNKQILLRVFRYYHREKRSPFKDDNSSKWWEGEKVMLDTLTSTKHGLEDWCYTFNDEINHALRTDNGLTLEEVAVPVFLSSWHRRCFPDDISDYMRSY